MIETTNNNIVVNSQKLKEHSKASEKYVDVTFKLDRGEWNGWIPVVYRRTGVDLQTDEEISTYISKIFEIMNSLKPEDWFSAESKYWAAEKANADITREFFDKLSEDVGSWKCREHELPANPNFARRIQDLKEIGYTLATDIKRYCEVCKQYKPHIQMLPIPRVVVAGNGYETWSPRLRKRIIKVLDSYDVYEGKKGQHLLPDHKFSEIRWDEHTKDVNPDDMTDEQIRDKFQLMSNQRNQQKREACRRCFQSGKRQFPFGIQYYYEGNENWDSSIPPKGKAAEQGCHGCGWYDMEKWRQNLIEKIDSLK